jgi:hypothetical protein
MASSVAQGYEELHADYDRAFASYQDLEERYRHSLEQGEADSLLYGQLEERHRELSTLYGQVQEMRTMLLHERDRALAMAFV